MRNRWLMIVCLLVGIAACALALALVGLANVPLESLREYGRLIRRPEDVTQERYIRFQQVCWFWAVGLASVGGGLLLRRRRCAEFLSAAIWPRVPPPLTSPSLVDVPPWKGWLALILCLGAALRLSLLGTPMAYDDSYSWVNFASHSLPLALGDLNSTNNHLLNTVCMYVSGHLFGPQEWALRIGVMSFGLAMLPLSFVWARRWRGTEVALLTTALLAVASPVVMYSVEARGYAYVMLTAVLLDDALAKVGTTTDRSEQCWVQAGMAIILGVWSMIIMGYAIVTSVGWFLLSGVSPARSDEAGEVNAPSGREMDVMTLWTKVGQVAVLGWLTALGSSLLYIPGYICRGTLFLNDPVMRKADSDSRSFLVDTASGWLGAAELWGEGAIPLWVLGFGVLLGAWFWPRDRRSLLRLLSPFAVVLALNLARHVNPPPRIYLWLMPWVCLLAAQGVVSGLRLLKIQNCGLIALMLMVLIRGVWQGAVHWPALLRSDNRMSYVSVPDVVQRLHREVASAPTEPHRLIAPLPCDLPSIFYMDRAGFRIPVNDIPQPGEHVWLMTRHHETPVDVLNSSLVNLPGWQGRFTTWEIVDRYQTLNLYTAHVLP